MSFYTYPAYFFYIVNLSKDNPDFSRLKNIYANIGNEPEKFRQYYIEFPDLIIPRKNIEEVLSLRNIRGRFEVCYEDLDYVEFIARDTLGSAVKTLLKRSKVLPEPSEVKKIPLLKRYESRVNWNLIENADLEKSFVKNITVDLDTFEAEMDDLDEWRNAEEEAEILKGLPEYLKSKTEIVHDPIRRTSKFGLIDVFGIEDDDLPL